MNTKSRDAEPAGNTPHLVLRILDRMVVSLVLVFIALATLKSRDPRERVSNIIKADREEQTRIRNWEGVLQWSPSKRVGCFIGVVIGIGIGGGILWYGMQ